MTDVSEMIERLRWYGRDSASVEQSVLLDAADALEAQAREIVRLRNGFEGACYCCEPVAVVNIELSRKLAEAVNALRAIEPFIPITSAAEGGAAMFSANVRAADMVRAALRSAGYAAMEGGE